MSRLVNLGLIPARAGSKGVPGKNIRPVNGKPLLAHAVECGLACPELAKVVVSTDSQKFADIAKEHGAEVPFLRPEHLAADQAPMLPVMQHAISACEKHYGFTVGNLVLLDPTGPLRLPEDIKAVLAMLEDDEVDCVVSGNAAHRSPYFNMVRESGGYVQLVIPPKGEVGRRQDAPPVYDLNTVVWAWKRRALMNDAARMPERTRLYLVPPERALDLDTEMDFLILETLLQKRAQDKNQGQGS